MPADEAPNASRLGEAKLSSTGRAGPLCLCTQDPLRTRGPQFMHWAFLTCLTHSCSLPLPAKVSNLSIDKNNNNNNPQIQTLYKPNSTTAQMLALDSYPGSRAQFLLGYHPQPFLPCARVSCFQKSGRLPSTQDSLIPQLLEKLQS